VIDQFTVNQSESSRICVVVFPVQLSGNGSVVSAFS